MGMPGMGDMGPIYIPKPIGALELNIGDEWRGRFTDADELPENAPVVYAYAVLFMGDKGYVTRPADTKNWGVIEGPLAAGETPDAWLARSAMAQAGATLARTDLIGFLDCKATSHNRDYAAGAVTVRPIYLAVAATLDDVPDESGYVRRRMPFNEHSKAIRARYPEIEPYITKTLDRYMVLRAKGEA